MLITLRLFKFIFSSEHLEFNAGKCIVKIGNMLKYTHARNVVCLNQIKEQIYLDILVSCDLSSRSHISEIVKKVNEWTGMTKYSFTNLTLKKVKHYLHFTYSTSNRI